MMQDETGRRAATRTACSHPLIGAPRSARALRDVRALFEAYMRSLGIDLAFQNADDELRRFPQAYRCLLYARIAGRTVGAVALKELDERCCEMKRLYCLPSARGSGIGRALAERIVLEARKLSYERMRLDTFASMTRAIALYESMGFQPIAAYYHNPYPDVRYFELPLRQAGGGDP